MQYIRRFIWFFAKRLIIISILAGMLVCGFFMAMNLGNVYIILSEGLEKRVDVMLTREDAQELNKYFTYDFLNNDIALTAAFDGSSMYDAYNITGFENKLTIEKLWCWPWDNYATCTVVQRIPSIQGKVISSRAGDVPAKIPPIQGGRYNITLAKEDGQWRIAGMQTKTVILEQAEEETAEQQS